MKKIPPNFKEVHCIYCGRIVRNTDKFCIFCGNKLPGSGSAPEQSKKQKIPEPEMKELEKEVNDDLNTGKMIENLSVNSNNQAQNTNVPFLVNENSMQNLDDRVLETSANESDKKQDESSIKIELPEIIKEQMETKMELAILEEKKSNLKKKLKELTETLSDDRYDQDIDYAQQINLKLNALKTLKQEMDNKEEQLRKDLGGNFRVDELEEQKELKRQQLIELKRSFKHREIKKDTVPVS